MNDFRNIQLKEVCPTHKKALAEWLTEWRLEQALADEELCGHIINAEQRRIEHCERDSVEPEGGQIRLLYPNREVTRQRPRYLLLMKREAVGWETIPFGRFACPATPEEWYTGRDALYLRVLCFWNAGVLATATIRESWYVDSLSPDEQEEVHGFRRMLSEDQALPAEVHGRTGPPLVHPLDPRHEYLAGERAWMKELNRQRLGNAFFPPYAKFRGEPCDLSRAAEDRPPYNPEDPLPDQE